MTPSRPHFLVGLLAASALGTAAAATPSSSTQQVYKWTDEKGVVHYSDAVPAQSADQDTTVLNSQGVPVGSVPGRRTPDQVAAEAARRTEEERTHLAAAQSRQRDQNLLATYLTVEEIEALRDRRADILDGQARVANAYLEQLRARQHQLEQQVKRFKPYNTSPNAPQLPEPLAEDLVRNTTDVATQQRNLELKKQDLDNMKAQFASDIARFRQLKKIETEYSRGAQPGHN
ncbi:MAG TPA: DUF4124 domain-containing protein [Steroidobacteraceae bacterium]|nr:DUF4124 domain-containing protein [Steroidobacteraceae bacterium]